MRRSATCGGSRGVRAASASSRPAGFLERGDRPGRPLFHLGLRMPGGRTHGEQESGKVRLLSAVAAHDVGKAVNPGMVRGQFYGGMAMAAGYALHEEVRAKEGRITTHESQHLPHPARAGPARNDRRHSRESRSLLAVRGEEHRRTTNEKLAPGDRERHLSRHRHGATSPCRSGSLASRHEAYVNGTETQAFRCPGQAPFGLSPGGPRLTGVKNACDIGLRRLHRLYRRPAAKGMHKSRGTGCAGRSILTIEGMAPPTAPCIPFSRRSSTAGAIQCGFCTPGNVCGPCLSPAESPRARTDPPRDLPRLCRCTGYQQIVDAIESAAPFYAKPH